MKITHNKVGQNLNLRDSGKTDTVSKTGTPSDSKKMTAIQSQPSETSNAVEFSPRAQQLQKAKEAVMSAPDINREKVERLKQLVQSGNYKVDADAVAERMLNEHLDWSE